MKYSPEEIKKMLEAADADGIPVDCPHTIIRDLLAEVERLQENIKRLQVQLAGYGVAAMCNTAQSRGQQKCAEGDYGWSQSSYQDAVNAVGREIALRDQLQAAQALAARHLADHDYLVALERKRVARECAEVAENHQPQEFADGCGTGKFIGRTIRARYGVEG